MSPPKIPKQKMENFSTPTTVLPLIQILIQVCADFPNFARGGTGPGCLLAHDDAGENVRDSLKTKISTATTTFFTHAYSNDDSLCRFSNLTCVGDTVIQHAYLHVMTSRRISMLLPGSFMHSCTDPIFKLEHRWRPLAPSLQQYHHFLVAL
jgi:hypothetical protein